MTTPAHSSETIAVAGIGLWLPGVPETTAWLGGARGVDARHGDYPAPTGASIEPRARRRTSPLSRALADAFVTAATQARVDTSTTAAVFGSALGEVSAMLTLLDQMSRGEPLSPMSFGTSVHSAASGVVSISAGNRGFTTSISAYHDTAASALFEARCLLETMGTPVVVACGDESSPDRFVDEAESFDMLAVAIALIPADYDAPVLARLSWPRRGDGDITPPVVSDRIARNPQIGLLDLAAALLAGQTGTVALDRGRGSGWCVSISQR
jgi:hypothetical protein